MIVSPLSSAALLCFFLSAVSTGRQPDTDPFASPAKARVLLFVRTDCPLTKRYAPELARIANEFSSQGAAFWIVYSERDVTTEAMEGFQSSYHLPGTPIRDPEHSLATRSHCTVSPEAAVFDAAGQLRYHGRIDDRWTDFGKGRPVAQVHDLEDAIRNTLLRKPILQAQTRAVGCTLADVN